MKYLVLLLILFVSINSYGQTDNRSINRIDTLNIDNIKINDAHADSSYSYGIVVIKVIVNKDGDVISADFLLDKSTVKDSVLLKSAREAALKAKFNKNTNAAPRQIGLITYKFKMINKN